MSYHYSDLDVPYFVYGTLRPGMGNDWCWRDSQATCYKDGQVIAPQWGLVGRGIPFAVPIDVLRYAGGDHIRPAVGALIYPGSDPVRLRTELDALEGHPHAYLRVPTVVYDRMTDDACIAWIYTMSRLDYSIGESRETIASGDYREETWPRMTI